MRRGGIVIGLAGAAALALLASPAVAAARSDGAAAALPVEEAAATLGSSKFVWNDTATGEPVSIVVRIAEQRAYVYRGATMIAASSVSTGRDGHETPAGSFTILQKDATHRSTIYDAAPMPYMERLTWDGVAIHAGRDPGFRTSHGCIHVSTEFARRLFAITQVGTVVTVVAEDGTIPDNPPQASAGGIDTSDETAAANRAASQDARAATAIAAR